MKNFMAACELSRVFGLSLNDGQVWVLAGALAKPGEARRLGEGGPDAIRAVLHDPDPLDRKIARLQGR